MYFSEQILKALLYFNTYSQLKSQNKFVFTERQNNSAYQTNKNPVSATSKTNSQLYGKFILSKQNT